MTDPQDHGCQGLGAAAVLAAQCTLHLHPPGPRPHLANEQLLPPRLCPVPALRLPHALLPLRDRLRLLLSTIFSRAKLAAIVGPVALFVTVLPRYVFFNTAKYEYSRPSV
jgi:hypothetical protein